MDKDWEKEVYNYWFSDCDNIPSSKKIRGWFMDGRKYDNDIKSRFGNIADLYTPSDENVLLLNQMVMQKSLYLSDKWRITFIGRIIMSDQLFRHIYRGSRDAFSWEFQNRDIIMKLFEDILKWNVNIIFELFSFSEVLFLLLPLIHYEPGENSEFHEINKVLVFWKKSFDKLDEIVDNKLKENAKLFIERAINNVERHYEQLKTNNGYYPERYNFT